MARDALLEVLLEVPKAGLVPGDQSDRQIVEKLRSAADEKASQTPGAVVRTDIAPEIRVSEGRHLITNEEMLLIASRWAVTVPDSAVS
jgi:hypothetical protein